MSNINNPKITKFMSKYGYNELLVYDVKVKDAYIVLDIVGDPNDFDKTEKILEDIKKDLKPFVKGKIYYRILLVVLRSLSNKEVVRYD